jgi:AAHS family 4-hydroxybenzoate transporter-like MFS transporter
MIDGAGRQDGGLPDRQAIAAFAMLFAALVSDGFDLQALGFAAPGIVREWGIARPALAPALSAGLVGVFVGAPVFGWVGDRIGRRRTVVLGSIVYGLFCLLSARAGSVNELVALRFGTGIGLGGVLPNAIALAAEVAPARRRALFTSLITIGISAGGLFAGVIAAWLVPDHGWRVLFVVGGVLPLLIALLIGIAMPESPAFRAERASADTGSRGGLFAGRFAIVTPLMWLLFAGVLMSIYLLTSWLPLALESGGMPARDAAIMNMMLQFGGIVGGLVASLLLARFRMKLVATMLICAFATSAFMAFVKLPTFALAIALGLCGVGLIGCQTAINAIAGLAYPTAIRARGVGSALGIGRLGSITGPLVGALFLSLASVGTSGLFLAPLVPLAVALGAALLLAPRLAVSAPEGGGR